MLSGLANLVLLVVTVAVVLKYADGNPTIVQVSNDEYLTSSPTNNSESCCVYENCSQCHSLDHALANLTSNVLINITTNVTLSLLTEVSHLENVSIIGHNNPTVNCTNSGALNITFCHNWIIQGIIWDGCGTEHEPGLKLRESSNITIQNCSFQHSIGQAVVLTGDVKINHCKFVNNTHYRGHGAAVHYSSTNSKAFQHVLVIYGCNFTYNKLAESLVYIESSIFAHKNTINFCHTKFDHNQGACVFVVNQNVNLKGKVSFHNNMAKNGAGIYISDHSTVLFGENSNVAFIENSANSIGGAVFLRNHSSIVIDQNSKVIFIKNKAINGTIYSESSSNVTFKATCQVIFNNNTAMQSGSAILFH